MYVVAKIYIDWCNTVNSLAMQMRQMFAAGLILMMESADNLLDYSLNFTAEFQRVVSLRRRTLATVLN